MSLKIRLVLSTFASANDPLTVQEDKSFNYSDRVQHQNMLPVGR